MESKDNRVDAVHTKVRAGYAAIAEQDASCCGPVCSCCGSSGDDASILAESIGYAPDDLAALPEGANMGLSCGNPVALASLKPGEVVVDLGSGGGFDVFIAGRRVGPKGRAIGVDMTPEMLSKARRNIEAYRDVTGLDNVEFRLGEIEYLPLPDNSADAVISNCVINLSPDKPQVWREIARVLKPGGRVAVSDLALLQPLPADVAEMVEALVGCIAGAVLVSETEQMARDAGLVDIELTEKHGYMDKMTDWNDPLYRKVMESLPLGAKMGEFVTSLQVSAKKAPAPCCCSQSPVR
ncbi:MAG: Arsenite methyltransferase [Candidatus Hydrogenedentes bacterium]|nr:Arsenite methyltransferase [Candidatus Hydrogenedentota bacterium]